MPYSIEHKQETRKRIVQSARRLFNRNGFAEVTIADIMGDAGLTHGGFYKHFSAKEDVYQEAVLEFICAERPEPWQARHIDPRASGPALARMIAEAYLSTEHFDDRDGSCPMIALPSDIARGNGAVREAFRQVLEMMVGVFAENFPPGRPGRRDRALALAAMVVGGMVLARAVDDKGLADDLRRSALKQVYETTGWDRTDNDEAPLRQSG